MCLLVWCLYVVTCSRTLIVAYLCCLGFCWDSMLITVLVVVGLLGLVGLPIGLCGFSVWLYAFWFGLFCIFLFGFGFVDCVGFFWF